MDIQKRLLLISCIVVLTACSSSNDSPPPAQQVESVDEISLGDLTTKLRLATANKEGTGFVVASDAAMIVIGSSLISGDNNNVEIDLTRPVVDDESITVTLHDDSNSSGSFEAETDLAAQSVGGGDINTAKILEVTADMPDVRLTMTANGFSSWSISAEPQSYNWGNVGSGNNPELTISVPGVRFEVVNPSVLSHPFSLINANAGNQELITQGIGASAGDGIFLFDGDVNVFQSGNIIQFTLTAALAAVVTNYRCDIHRNTMVGAINIM